MASRTLGRTYRDKILSKTLFKGRVLDVGGQKDAKRGNFRPPIDLVTEWKYLNTDERTNPDYLCSAEEIPLDEGSIDTAVLSEVLEHLENPDRVLAEIGRVLVPGGTLIATMPFMFGIHADPDDYQRWTPSRIKIECKKAGLHVTEIKPMGGLVAVVHDMIYQAVSMGARNPQSIGNKIIRRILLPAFALLDRPIKNPERVRVTTGYYIVATK